MGIPKIETKQTQVFLLGGEVVTRAELEALRGHITAVLEDADDVAEKELFLDGFSTSIGMNDSGYGVTVAIVQDGPRITLRTRPRDLRLAASIMDGKEYR